MLIANPHAVPVKQWRKWSHLGKQVFNAVYEEMHAGQNLFTHPQTEQVPEAQWMTTCWNAAWVAADAATKGATLC